MDQNRSEVINLYPPPITLLEHYSKKNKPFQLMCFLCVFTCLDVTKSLLKAYSYSITPKLVFKKYLKGMKFCILFNKKLIEMESHIFVRWVISNSRLQN